RKGNRTRGSPCPLRIDQSPYSSRVSITQLFRQRLLRKILLAERADKSLDRCRAYAGRARIGGGGIGAAVHHRLCDFDAGWKSVEQQPANLPLQNRDQIARLA